MSLGRRFRRVLGALLGSVVALWCRTLRVVVEGTVEDGVERRVFAFLHGHQMVLLGAARRRRLAVLVSHSLDGELQAGVMGRAGFTVVRGSSSKGGASGLAAIISLLRAGRDAAFAVDGPRGPCGIAHGGAVLAARAGAAWIVPVAASLRRGLVLRRAWDQLQIPLPFSRVAIVIGVPLDPREATARELTLALAVATERARDLALGKDGLA